MYGIDQPSAEHPMKKRLLALALCAAPTLALSTPAEAARPAEVNAEQSAPVTLRLMLQRGLTRSYTFEGQLTREGLEGTAGNVANLEASLRYTFEVQSVADDGTVDIAASLTEPVMRYAVNEEEEGSDDLFTSVRDARLTVRAATDGSLRERSGTIDTRTVNPDIGSFLQDAFNQLWIQFPQEPVAAGDSWMQVVPLTLGATASGIEAAVNARYTFAGFADVDGVNTAVIDVQYATEIDGNMSVGAASRLLRVVGRGTGTGHILFDPARGVITEMAVDNGSVLTATETNGRRSTQAVSSSASLTLDAPRPDEDSGN